jgi:cytochrome c-type biogenesis protein CcmH
MMFVFVLVAGTLAAAAAVLLAWPLMRRREDGRPASVWPAMGLLVAVLFGGAALYAGLSKYSWVEQPAMADTPAAMTARLAKRLAGEPENLEGWLMLGRSYTQLQQFELAMRAYQRADRLAGGKNIEAVFGVADILVSIDMEELRGRAGRLYEHALDLDPKSEKALFYSAFAALGRGEGPLARQRFEALLAQNPRDDVRGLVEQGLARIDESPGGAPAASAPVAAGDAKIAVRVTLAPGLAAQVPKDAVLFVAARDPQSPGPPFAVKRLPAKFPVEVELTGADAMLESRRIASGRTYEVVARIALGGTPTATRGDPVGRVGYHVGKDGRLDVVIDRLSD